MKIRRSRKALSPVIATIILIAVTVAVSIAVAAWMGALTFSFMATEQGQVTNLQFTTGDATHGQVMIWFNNTGTTAITISQVWVNNVQVTTTTVGSPIAVGASVAANQGTIYTVTMLVQAGYSYSVELVSTKGNKFTSAGSAPS
jgi:flagellin-like protein